MGWLTLARVVLPLALVGLVTADDATDVSNLTCPISGGPVKATNFITYKTKKVYFCCKNCPKAFESDTAQYLPRVLHQLVLSGQAVQVGCPMSGKPVNDATIVEFAGVKAGFCCDGCKGKFGSASDEEKLAALFGEASKAWTLQTTCPLSGKPIKPAKHIEHDGQLVYFCCDGCSAAFQKDPAAHVAKLPQFVK